MPVPGRAGAFARDHAGADRILRCAGAVEQRARGRLDRALQDLTAAAAERLARRVQLDLEPGRYRVTWYFGGNAVSREVEIERDRETLVDLSRN